MHFVRAHSPEHSFRGGFTVSRPMLYATLAVLFAILLGTSYALNKQTEPPKQEQQKEMTPEQRAEMEKRMADQRKMMMENEKKSRAEMAKRMKAQQALEKEKAAKLAALGIRKPKANAGADISDKWFSESSDGAAGIQQAIREKEITDQLNAAHPTPAPPASSSPKIAPMMTAPDGPITSKK